MAVQTTYICDRCKSHATSPGTLDLEIVEVVWGRNLLHVQLASVVRGGRSTEWCKECRIRTGLQSPTPAGSIHRVNVAMTIEEFLQGVIKSAQEALRYE